MKNYFFFYNFWNIFWKARTGVEYVVSVKKIIKLILGILFIFIAFTDFYRDRAFVLWLGYNTGPSSYYIFEK